MTSYDTRKWITTYDCCHNTQKNWGGNVVDGIAILVNILIVCGGETWFYSVPPGECRSSSLKWSHDRFLPNPFQFIILLSPFNYTLYSKGWSQRGSRASLVRLARDAFNNVRLLRRNDFIWLQLLMYSSVTTEWHFLLMSFRHEYNRDSQGYVVLWMEITLSTRVKGPIHAQVNCAVYHVWRHTWQINWVNCAVPVQSCLLGCTAV
jgi:hypothetical protein